jgi:hypothetical protein
VLAVDDPQARRRRKTRGSSRRLKRGYRPMLDAKALARKGVVVVTAVASR